MFETWNERLVAWASVSIVVGCVGSPPKVDETRVANTGVRADAGQDRPPASSQDAGGPARPSDDDPDDDLVAGSGSSGASGSSGETSSGAGGGSGSSGPSGNASPPPAGTNGSGGTAGQPQSADAGSHAGGGGSAGSSSPRPTAACGFLVRSKECDTCLQLQCTTPCGDCDSDHGCADAYACLLDCTGTACEACVATLSEEQSQHFVDVYDCFAETCRVQCLPPPKLGDACNDVPCGAGTCSSWCTTTCTAHAMCGTNSRGRPNVCLLDTENTRRCFPGCRWQSDCTGFTDTECVNVDGVRACSSVDLQYTSAACNACAYEYCANEHLECASDAGCNQRIRCTCADQACTNCESVTPAASALLFQAVVSCTSQSCAGSCG
jgi:hypothetical protein